MKKKVIWGISMISLIETAIALQFLPARIPMHYNLSGNIDRWGNKYENLIFPVIGLILALVWTVLICYYEKKAEKASDEKTCAGAKSNANVLSVAGIAVATVYTGMQGVILLTAYTVSKTDAQTATVDLGKIACILLGALLMILGNFMTKTRVNGVVGVRVKWSMYNDNTWRRSNRFGAFAFVATGVLTILSGVFMKSGFYAMMVGVVYAMIAATVSVVYAHRVYIQEIDSERKGDEN